MAFIGIIVSGVTSLIICFISSYTLLYLIAKRNVFPYSNISPIWIIFTLISVCLSQLVAETTYINNVNFDYTEPPEIFSESFNLLFVHHMQLIPLLVRIFSLGESIKYNYHHISKKFYDENFQIQQDEHYRNRYYMRTFYYIKSFIIPLAFSFILSITLIVIPFTRCSITATVYSFYDYEQKSCEGKPIDSQTAAVYELVGGIIVNVYLTLEMCVFMTLIVRVFRYPIANDKFSLRLEFISLFILWVFSFDLLLGAMYMFKYHLCNEKIFIINSFRNGSIAVTYALVTYIRKKITSDEIKSMMIDFDSFMYCHVGFTFFRDYIKVNHEEDYKLLSFWIEYHLFKKQAANLEYRIREFYFKKERKRTSEGADVEDSKSKSPNFTLNSDERDILNFNEESLRDLGNGIFEDYFSQNRSNLPSSSFMQIDFPVDIYEKVEDAYRRSFNIENLPKIFDEAFSIVYSKLFNLFLTFLRNETEYKKLERIFFFVDFYEIKRLNVNLS